MDIILVYEGGIPFKSAFQIHYEWQGRVKLPTWNISFKVEPNQRCTEIGMYFWSVQPARPILMIIGKYNHLYI